MIDMEKLKFDEEGLIPHVWMGPAARCSPWLYEPGEPGHFHPEERTCFWSRSRQELWRKGETSGAVQHIIDITADCDCDALVIRVNKEGPACHTGAESCFHNPLFVSQENHRLLPSGPDGTAPGPKGPAQEGSYTSYLLTRDWTKS